MRSVFQFPEEDEETRLYRLKIEEQKRLREEILKQKELRRQQQAGARKKELLERLAQQQQLCAPAAPPEREEQPAVPSPLPSNGNPLLPFPGAPVRQSVKNRLLVKSQDAAPSDLQPKTPGFVPSGASMPYPGQAVRPLKHLRHKVLQVQPADGDAPPLAQTARGASLQGRPPDAKPCAKRTVMHRASSGGGDGPHISSKVRVIKLSGGVSAEVSATPGSLRPSLRRGRAAEGGQGAPAQPRGRWACPLAGVWGPWLGPLSASAPFCRQCVAAVQRVSAHSSLSRRASSVLCAASGAVSPGARRGARRERAPVFPLAVRGQRAPGLCPTALSASKAESWPLQDRGTESVPAHACRRVLAAGGPIRRQERGACSLQRGSPAVATGTPAACAGRPV